MKAKSFVLLTLTALCLALAGCPDQQDNAPEDRPSRPPGEGLDNDTGATNNTKDPSVVIPDGYQLISWQDLSDVQFEVRFFEEANDSLLFPNFGPKVKALEGKPVAIEGYVIPVDYEHYVLSANPFSKCFFCGNAGPESVMELPMVSYDGVLFYTDEFRTFYGTLRLNDQNVDQLNYILEEAQVL